MPAAKTRLASNGVGCATRGPRMSGAAPNKSSQRNLEDVARAADQNSKILTLLQNAGSRGVTNSEMWAIGAHAAHSRISDLRKRGGYQITCKREGPGVWRYFLHTAPDVG